MTSGIKCLYFGFHGRLNGNSDNNLKIKWKGWAFTILRSLDHPHHSSTSLELWAPCKLQTCLYCEQSQILSK